MFGREANPGRQGKEWRKTDEKFQNYKGTICKKDNMLTTFVFSLGFGAFIMLADRTILYPMLKVISSDFNLSSTATGFITTTYFFLYVGMQVPAGMLGDSFGLKKVLIAFYLLGAFSLLLLGFFANNYFGLVLLIGLHGIGMGAFYPASYGLNIGFVPKSKRGLASAVINCGMSLGTALGLVFSGPVYNRFNSWRLPFLILAIPSLIVPVIFGKYLPEISQRLRVKTGRSSHKNNLKKILMDKDLWKLNLSVFCSGYGFWVAITWGPSFFALERSFSLTLAGVFTAIPALAGIPPALFAGRLSDRFGRRKTALALYPLQSIAILALVYARSIPVLVTVLVLYGIVGRTVSDTVMIAWFGDHVSEKCPEALGSAVGIYNLVGMSSAIFAPLISGLVKDLTGSLSQAFFLGALVVLLGMVFVASTKET